MTSLFHAAHRLGLRELSDAAVREAEKYLHRILEAGD